jgi:hypothetical protein
MRWTNRSDNQGRPQPWLTTPPPLPPQGRQETHVTNRTVHQFTGDTTGKRHNVALHINKDTIPYSIFILYFVAVITLMLETNWYYHQYLDTYNVEPSLVPHVTESEMFLFLVIIVQMGKDIRNSLKHYWLTTQQFPTPFCGKTSKFTCLDICTLQIMIILLRKMTKTMTDYEK